MRPNDPSQLLLPNDKRNLQTTSELPPSRLKGVCVPQTWVQRYFHMSHTIVKVTTRRPQPTRNQRFMTSYKSTQKPAPSKNNFDHEITPRQPQKGHIFVEQVFFWNKCSPSFLQFFQKRTQMAYPRPAQPREPARAARYHH